MKKQIVKLFFFLALMMVSVVGKGQNWTWTGEAWKDASTKYYLRQASGDRYVTGDNKIVTDINSAALWTISGTSGATIQAVGGQKIHDENQTWALNGESVNGSQAYSFTTQVRVIFSTNTYYVYISSNAISTTTNNGTASDTKNWYLISEAQVTARNNFFLAYNIAVTYGVSSDILNANNTANSSNVESKIEALKNAVAAKLASVNFDTPLNLTSLIANPDFEASPWNLSWNGTGDNKEVAFAKNDNHTNYAEMWKGAAVGGKVYQTISNLPKGYYTLSASTAGDPLNSVYAKVGDYVYQQAKGEGDWIRTSVVFRIDEEQADVEIGYERPGNVWWWSAVDDFQLEYMGTNPAYEYNIGIRLDGSYLSKPAYTGTPMEGVDDAHKNDALLVVTWRDNYTNDPTDAVNSLFKLVPGSTAEIWTDGAKVTDVNLLTDFRSSHYTNGFGLYIPNFDEDITYTIKVPENVFGYTAVGHGNEAFEVQAVASPLKDGKYFVVVKGTGKHVSRGKGWGTQAILDYYGVPMLVQTAGLTTFKFLDNNAFMGSDPTDNWLFTDIHGSEGHKVRRYVLVPGEGEHEGEFQFYAPAREKYLSHVQNSIAGETYDAVNEGGNADYFQFEILDEDGYKAHLAKIEEDEAIRVAARAGFAVSTKSEYDTLIKTWESKGYTEIFPAEDATAIKQAAAYHEKKNEELACDAVWEGTPRDLVGGDKVSFKLAKGLYVMYCDAFQQAMNLTTLQANQGFRGLTYMYVKVGSEMYKSQLKSITETTGTIPTDEATATTALNAGTYRSQVIFYVPADGTSVEFGVENPQRLGNGVDATAGSWVAFKNIKVEKFNAELAEANMKITAGKYGTFIAPFAVKLPAGVTAYTGTLNGEKTSVALTSAATEGTELAACTPVIVKNDGDTDVDMTYREVDVRNNKTTVTEQKGVLVGFYKSYAEDNTAFIDGDEDSWVLQTQDGKQAFYKVEPGTTFKGSKNRCYLVATSTNGVKVLNFEFADEETAIENLANGATIVEYYSVNGSKLSAPQKGINLVKMSDSTVKKIIVK